jgi:hypothetical protein
MLRIKSRNASWRTGPRISSPKKSTRPTKVINHQGCVSIEATARRKPETSIPVCAWRFGKFSNLPGNQQITFFAKNYFVTSFFGKRNFFCEKLFCDQLFWKTQKMGSQYYHKNVATFCDYFCGIPKHFG